MCTIGIADSDLSATWFIRSAVGSTEAIESTVWKYISARNLPGTQF